MFSNYFIKYVKVCIHILKRGFPKISQKKVIPTDNANWFSSFKKMFYVELMYFQPEFGAHRGVCIDTSDDL